MNQIKISIFFTYLFSYIFSIKINKIEPNIVTFDENIEFNLTVEDYDSSKNYNFS